MTMITVNGQVVNNSVDFDTPSAPWQMVQDRFDETLAKAEDVYKMLVGPTGTSGYLGDMQAAIASAPVINIPIPSVNTNISLATSNQSIPTFDPNDLQSYPVASYADPVLSAVPVVDDDVGTVTEPSDISVSMSWSEASLPSTVYDAIWTRMLADLQSGATGLDPTVEAAIYARARLKQQNERLAEYNKINDVAAQMQFQLPSGVLVSSLTDFGIGATRMDADITNNIITTQADLAQKNSQFMMQQAIALEELIRRTRTEESGRALDSAKTMATLMAEDYRNRVQKYVAIWESKKVKVQAQVEAMRGVIESNKGLIEIFKAQYDSLKTRVEAVSSFNKGITDVYLGQVSGFGEAEKAIGYQNDSTVKLLAEKVKVAEMEVKAATAEAEQTIAGYVAEGSVKEKFSHDIASIAAQVVASMLSAVHAGATLGYSGSESSSKSFQMGSHLTENHSYEHDPLA